VKKEALQLRIGVLGCGPIAQAAHFEACRRARNAELYAICDLAEDLVARMSAIHEPRVTYLDYDEMLADPQIEAVIVATADQFHVEHASRALAAGKHVLVEKPIGVTVDECEALCEQVQGSGLILQIGTMKRFDPGIAFARQFIKEDMGQLLALKAWYCDSTYRYTMTDNLQPILVTSAHARRPVGDPKANKRRYYLLGHGSHLVDTARFLGGEIVRVQARLIEKFGAYCWFVATEFADGSVGHLDLTMAVRMDWHEGFQVYGEYGSVVGKTPNPWYLRSSAPVRWSASACVMGSTIECSVRMHMSINCNLRASRTRFCMVRLCMVQISRTVWQLCGRSSRSRVLSKPGHGLHWPM
jgi:predicted dehydrogenase